MHTDTTTRGSHAPDQPSGRFLLRISPGLHGALREAARAADLSLNDYCARKLASPGGDVGGAAPEAVERAASMFGADLVGVLAYGSWARDQLSERSDVDLLIVIEPRVPITRGLYKPWDALPLEWGSHRVEPHFVHLPEADARVSGVWAEAALDAIVLFERASQLSRRLVMLRRRILAGDLVRRRVHGQPYWVEAA